MIIQVDLTPESRINRPLRGTQEAIYRLLTSMTVAFSCMAQVMMRELTVSSVNNTVEVACCRGVAGAPDDSIYTGRKC